MTMRDLQSKDSDSLNKRTKNTLSQLDSMNENEEDLLF